MDTPQEVAEKLIRGISAGRYAELAALYAEDCVIEVPLAPGRGRPRTEGGAAIRKHFAAMPDQPFTLRVHDLVVHRTEDPELVVAEWDYEVTSKTTGRSVLAANVQFLRVRDGLIVHTRDFHDHPRFAEVLSDQ